jgi:hypothetical protein
VAKKGSGRTVVHVRWFDASYQRGELTEDELSPRVEMESAGLLVREDGDNISLALDYYREDGLWRHVEHIPKVNLLRITRLAVPPGA